MKQLLSILLLIGSAHASIAQISFKSEYIGSSNYHPEGKEKASDSKGSSHIHQAHITLPVSVNKDSLPTIWGINLSGAVAHLDNRHFTNEEVVSKITNLQVSLFHLRPLTNNWSLLAFAGAGLYTGETSLSNLKSNQILGNAGAIFIKKISKDLELGGGAVFNNAFGYPMLFPAFYFNYSYEGRYQVKASMMDGFEFRSGYSFNKIFSLYLTTEMTAQLALVERNKKEVIFTHQYIIVGVRPELTINEKISIPLTLGMNATRFAYYTDRDLKSIFEDTENEAHFGISLYVGIGLKLDF